MFYLKNIRAIFWLAMIFSFEYFLYIFFKLKIQLTQNIFLFSHFLIVFLVNRMLFISKSLAAPLPPPLQKLKKTQQQQNTQIRLSICAADLH